MNDPRESQFRQVVTMRTGQLDGGIPHVTNAEREAFEAALRELRGRVRLACFTEDRTDGQHSGRDDRRGYAHSRMWTQYATGQSGVCLVFDRARLIAAAETTFGSQVRHQKVRYVSGFDHLLNEAESVDFDHPDPIAHHKTKVLPGLFAKNVDWASEFEYRLLVDGWDDTPCMLPITDSLVGVALGRSFMPHQLPVIECLAEQFQLGHEVAHVILNCGVLQAWPSRDRYGALRVWSDEETRKGAIFDRE
jgi:hypothetical protein